jgi:hypothetical protein
VDFPVLRRWCGGICAKRGTPLTSKPCSPNQ